ncbi:MAG: hypothetical protein GWP08_03995 [Nitrospiraceae bacterium]|nr:hypothetical protein [Nitrospiraceae bacterium]
MPRKDGTGPTGKGAGTGRRQGPCGSERSPEEEQAPNRQPWQGAGRGLGQGRGQQRRAGICKKRTGAQRRA